MATNMYNQIRERIKQLHSRLDNMTCFAEYNI